jgi:hypothetical protein
LRHLAAFQHKADHLIACQLIIAPSRSRLRSWALAALSARFFTLRLGAIQLPGRIIMCASHATARHREQCADKVGSPVTIRNTVHSSTSVVSCREPWFESFPASHNFSFELPGHYDECLKNVAKAINQCFRVTTLLGRPVIAAMFEPQARARGQRPTFTHQSPPPATAHHHPPHCHHRASSPRWVVR